MAKSIPTSHQHVSRRGIRTDNAPAPGGHYSQAVRVGNQVYVAGSGPFDPKTHKIVGTSIVEQTRKTLENVAAILEAAGSSLNQVVQVTAYLKNMDDFPGMDNVFKEKFKKDPPARTTVQAGLYGKDRLIVLDAIAYVP